MALLDSNSEILRHPAPTEAERLSAECRFDLEGHELIDPPSNRGTVVGINEVESVSMAGETLPQGVKVFEVDVVDPFVEADPEGYKHVNRYISRIEDVLTNEGFDPLVERQKTHPYMREGETPMRRRVNQFTEAWLSEGHVEALKAWHSLVPSAVALGYLTQPWVGRDIPNKKGATFVSTPETSAQLRFVDDAVGIRDRAAAMEAIALGHLATVNSSDKKIKWLSQAGGTAEPSIAASQAATDRFGHRLKLVVVDNDESSLKLAQENAELYGYEGELITASENITAEDFPEKIMEATGDDGYDVVENSGFLEYLPQNGDELGAFRDIGFLPQASEFTKRAFSLVKPGGVLISGNMVVDRPQVRFVFGYVNWPIINARSEESIMRVYREAGILEDPQAQVEMYRVKNAQTGSHLYNIVKVRKLSPSSR